MASATTTKVDDLLLRIKKIQTEKAACGICHSAFAESERQLRDAREDIKNLRSQLTPLPPTTSATGAEILLWVRAADLTGSVPHNGAVTSWVQADRSKPPGVGSAVGSGGAPPVFYAQSEAHPFVRLAASTGVDPAFNGGFFEFGPLSVRLATQCFTAFVCVRWRGPAAANWARVFDFGNGAGTGNLLLARMQNTSRWNFQQHNATPQVPMGNFTDDTWQVLAMRLAPASRSLTFVGPRGRFDQAWNPPANEPTVFKNGWVGRSQWNGDTLATMDIREIRMFGKALDETEFTAIRAEMMRSYGIAS